jgi:glycosyltransferase involved in cell wall biosynthesis
MRVPVPDLSLVIPVFNEAESLPELADQIVSACGEAGLSFEAWLIDDGSKDESWAVIEGLHASDDRFIGLRFHKNNGKSAALAVGFEHARGRYVVTLDADLQDDPAEIPALVETLEEGFDLVSGWKHKRRDPLSKKVPSRFFNLVTRWVTGIRLHDFNCGLKIYRREVVKRVRLYGELHRYIPVLAYWEGYERIGEKTVRHRPRKYGITKFGLERFVRGFLDLITVIFLTRFARRPMHFFGTFGTLAFIAGFGVSLYLTVLKLMGQGIGNRPLLFLGILLLILGVQLFSTGLLGEMIIRPSMERTESYPIQETTSPDLVDVNA